MRGRRSDDASSLRGLLSVGFGVAFAAGLVVFGAAQASADDRTADVDLPGVGAAASDLAGRSVEDVARTVDGATRSPIRRAPGADGAAISRRVERPRGHTGPTPGARSPSPVTTHRPTPARTVPRSLPRAAEHRASRAPSTRLARPAPSARRPVAGLTGTVSTVARRATGATRAAAAVDGAAARVPVLDRVLRDRTVARTLSPAVDGVVASVGRTAGVLDQVGGRIVETRPPTDVDPAGAVRRPPSRIVDAAAAPRPQPSGPVLADPSDAGADVAERAVPPDPAPDLRPATDTASGTGRASSAPSAAGQGVDDVDDDVDVDVDVAAGHHPTPPTVGSTAPSGPSAATAATGTAPLAAYLDHDLLGLHAGITLPAGHADWILPGSRATVPGSSPD